MQTAIDADPEARKVYPDVQGLMQRVQAKLEKQPVLVTVKDDSGQDVKVAVTRLDVQFLAAGSISDPSATAMLLALYAQMDSGDFARAGAVLYRYRDSIRATRMRGMPEAMDAASGISEERLRQVQMQARTSIVGDVLNFPMPHFSCRHPTGCRSGSPALRA